MPKSESTILKKWKELKEQTDEEKVLKRALIKLRAYLRSQSRSPTGVVNIKSRVDGRHLMVKITKAGTMTIEYQYHRSHYFARMTNDVIDYIQYRTVKLNDRSHLEPLQDTIVAELKSVFKLCYPLYNVKAKITARSTMTKNLVPSGYSASINS
ncbi:hypothetical protein D3C81_336040 [compost metagenome]